MDMGIGTQIITLAMKMVEISVIVPVRNASRYLDSCISALEAQTFKDFEVVFVVDTSSTDESLSLLKKYSGPLDIKIVEQTEKSRLGGARNIGVKHASGKYIWFYDADDHPYPFLLEKAYTIAEQRNADVLFFNHFQVTDNKVPLLKDKNYGVIRFEHHSAVGQFESLPVYSWSRIQKASIFACDYLSFKSYVAMEDFEQTVCTLCAVDTVYFYEMPLYVYVKHDDSATKKNRRDELAVLVETIRSLIKIVSSKVPHEYPSFLKTLSLRAIRQSAFACYSDYSSYHRKILEELDLPKGFRLPFEFKVYHRFKFLYYVVLYPFTHWIWDRKKGIWKEVSVKH